MSDPRYPIGQFQPLSRPSTDPERNLFLAHIREVPDRLSSAVLGMTPAQLATPYREGGWMVRQVVHHVADSHMNAYVRTKLVLTEDQPTIKPYREAGWAEVVDARSENIGASLQLVESLHTRWVECLVSLKAEDFQRTFMHPEHGVRTLDWLLQLYSWHGRHHVGQILSLKQRMGW